MFCATFWCHFGIDLHIGYVSSAVLCSVQNTSTSIKLTRFSLLDLKKLTNMDGKKMKKHSEMLILEKNKILFKSLIVEKCSCTVCVPYQRELYFAIMIHSFVEYTETINLKKKKIAKLMRVMGILKAHYYSKGSNKCPGPNKRPG